MLIFADIRKIRDFQEPEQIITIIAETGRTVFRGKKLKLAQAIKKCFETNGIKCEIAYSIL